MKKSSICGLWLSIVMIVSIACMPYASAQIPAKSTQNYGNWDTISIEQQDHTIRISTGANRIALDNQGNFTVLGLGKCIEYSTEKACFEERINNDTVRISIYDIRPLITVAVEHGPSSIIIGGESQIEIRVSNQGNYHSNVSLIQELERGILAKDAKGCSTDGRRVVWDGILEREQSHSCRYTIFAKEGGEWEITSMVVHSQREETVESDLEAKVQKVHMPFELDVIFSNHSLMLGQEAYAYICIRNNNTKTSNNQNIIEKNISIRRMELREDEHIALKEQNPRDAMLIAEGILITPNRSACINTTFKAVSQAADHDLMIDVTYRIHESQTADYGQPTQKTFPVMIPLNITQEGLEFFFDVPEQASKPYDFIRIDYGYENLNPYVSIMDMHVNVTHSNKEMVSFNMQDKTREAMIIEVPYVKTRGHVDLIAYITFRDSMDQEHMIIESFKLLIDDPSYIKPRVVKEIVETDDDVIYYIAKLVYDSEPVNMTIEVQETNEIFSEGYTIDVDEQLEYIIFNRSIKREAEEIVSSSTMTVSFLQGAEQISDMIDYELRVSPAQGEIPSETDVTDEEQEASDTEESDQEDAMIGQSNQMYMITIAIGVILVMLAFLFVIIKLVKINPFRSPGVFLFRIISCISVLFRLPNRKKAKDASSKQGDAREESMSGPEGDKEKDEGDEEYDQEDEYDLLKKATGTERTTLISLFDRRQAIEAEMNRILAKIEKRPQEIDQAYELEKRYLKVSEDIKRIEERLKQKV